MMIAIHHLLFQHLAHLIVQESNAAMTAAAAHVEPAPHQLPAMLQANVFALPIALVGYAAQIRFVDNPAEPAHHPLLAMPRVNVMLAMTAPPSLIR